MLSWIDGKKTENSKKKEKTCSVSLHAEAIFHATANTVLLWQLEAVAAICSTLAENTRAEWLDAHGPGCTRSRMHTATHTHTHTHTHTLTHTQLRLITSQDLHIAHL